MKHTVLDFLRRGMTACGIGPLVLAGLYIIFQESCGIETLTVHEVCMGIVSLSALAFIAGGMNVVYQIERLPLMAAIAIHGIVLYISYLLTYLVNGWLEWSRLPVLVFTAIFIAGFLLIWAGIFTVMWHRTKRINAILKEKQTQ